LQTSLSMHMFTRKLKTQAPLGTEDINNNTIISRISINHSQQGTKANVNLVKSSEPDPIVWLTQTTICGSSNMDLVTTLADVSSHM